MRFLHGVVIGKTSACSSFVKEDDAKKPHAEVVGGNLT